MNPFIVSFSLKFSILFFFYISSFFAETLSLLSLFILSSVSSMFTGAYDGSSKIFVSYFYHLYHLSGCLFSFYFEILLILGMTDYFCLKPEVWGIMLRDTVSYLSLLF